MATEEGKVDPAVELAWAVANAEACRAGSRQIEPAHYLLAVLKIADDAWRQDAAPMTHSARAKDLADVAARCRAALGLGDAEITSARRGLTMTLRTDRPEVVLRRLHRSAASQELFGRAATRGPDGADVTLTALVAELLAEPGPEAAAAAPLAARPAPPPPPPAARRPEPTWGRSDDMNPTPMRSATPTIDDIGRDLTALARRGRLPPVFGREAEMKTLARCLQRTQKRNAILVGEAGVGKTAIVEGLAQRFASEEAPAFLRELRVVQVSVADLTAGTAYRGAMESRVQRVVEEAVSDPDLVLFLDEIHLVMKTGSGGESPMDVANLLKPALAREDLRCIGATTTEEFDRHIRPDAAFARRFQVLLVEPPGPHQTLHICQESARRIEQLQDVVISDEAVEAAVRLSTQLIHDRSQPDKAIDLLENAAAYAKVSSLTFRPGDASKLPAGIGVAEIERVLEEQYKVNVRRSGVIDLGAARALLDRQLVGQGQAVGQLLEALAGMATRGDEATRPLGVLMFTGPTGVGKTFAAECLAQALFGDDGRGLGRFNMSEYKERHELARLVGAPPGFIGHDQGAALFKFVDVNPQGLILLDEMEKAHPEVQDYFLQIFDKGEAADPRGRKARFNRHLFVITCNIVPQATAPSGYSADWLSEVELPSVGARDELQGHFRPEFLARIDRVITFPILDVADFRVILNRRSATLAADLAARRVMLDVDEAVITHLASRAASQGEGARGASQLFERHVSGPVLELAHRVLPGDAVAVGLAPGGVVRVTGPAGAAGPGAGRG